MNRAAHRFYIAIAMLLVLASFAAFALAIGRPGSSSAAATQAATQARLNASVLASMDEPLEHYLNASRGGPTVRISCLADCRPSAN